MYTRSLRVLFAPLWCAFLLGCASTRTTPATDDHTAPLRALNGRGDTLAAGIVYAHTGDTLRFVIDPLGIMSAGIRNGFVRTSENSRTASVVLQQLYVGDQLDCSNLFVLMHPECNVPTRVTVALSTSRISSVALIDPFMILELVNRPLTGFAYNRDAEQRIAQWRTSLALAMQSASTRVRLCTALDTVTEGAVLVTGRISRERAISLSSDALAGTSITIDKNGVAGTLSSDGVATFSIPIASPVLVRAIFRDIEINQSTVWPRVDFSIGGPRVIGFDDAM